MPLPILYFCFFAPAAIGYRSLRFPLWIEDHLPQVRQAASPEAKVRLTKPAGTAPCDSLPQPVLSSCASRRRGLGCSATSTAPAHTAQAGRIRHSAAAAAPPLVRAFASCEANLRQKPLGVSLCLPSPTATWGSRCSTQRLPGSPATPPIPCRCARRKMPGHWRRTCAGDVRVVPFASPRRPLPQGDLSGVGSVLALSNGYMGLALFDAAPAPPPCYPSADFVSPLPTLSPRPCPPLTLALCRRKALWQGGGAAAVQGATCSLPRHLVVFETASHGVWCLDN
eukprot:COSAG01_NODE_992_length_12250_cov_14.174356_8_plen_282_part_00